MEVPSAATATAGRSMVILRAWQPASSIIVGAMGVSLPRVCQIKNALAGALTAIGYAPGGAAA